MAVSINISVPFATIEAIQDDEGITQAPQKLAVNPGASSKVLHKIAANVVKVVEELPYVVTAKHTILSKAPSSAFDAKDIFLDPERGNTWSRASSPSFGARSTKSKARSPDLDGWDTSSPLITPSSPVESCGAWDNQSNSSSRTEVPKHIVVTICYGWGSNSDFILTANDPFNRLVELYCQRNGTKRGDWVFETSKGRLIEQADYQKSLRTLGIMSGAYLEASKKFGDNESGGYQEFEISIRDLMGKEHGFCFEPTDTFQDIVDCYREEAGYERVDLDFFRVQSGEEYELDFLAFSEGLNLHFDNGEVVLCKPTAAKAAKSFEICVSVCDAMEKNTYLRVDRKSTMAELDKMYRKDTDNLLPSLVYTVLGTEYSSNTKGWAVRTLKNIGVEDGHQITVRLDTKSTRAGLSIGYAGHSGPVRRNSIGSCKGGWDSKHSFAGGWD